MNEEQPKWIELYNKVIEKYHKKDLTEPIETSGNCFSFPTQTFYTRIRIEILEQMLEEILDLREKELR